MSVEKQNIIQQYTCDMYFTVSK